MNRATFLVLTLALVLSSAVIHLQAQTVWRSMYLPDTNSVRAIALSKDQTIYVGTTSNSVRSTNVWRSTDNGYSWTSLTDTSWAGHLEALNVAPNGNVYAVVGEVLYGSTDNGDSWDTLAVSGVSFHTVTVTATGTVFAAPGYGEGIRRSTDGGATWTQMKLPATELDVFALCSTGADTIYAGTDGWSSISFIRSTDNGETWTQQTGGMANIDIYALAWKEGGYLFAGSWSSDSTHQNIYRSTDFGMTWKSTGLKNTHITSLVTDARGDLYAGMRTASGSGAAQTGVYRSTDNGETWSGMNTGLQDTNVNVIVVGPTGRALVGTDRGLSGSLGPLSDVSNTGSEARGMTIECSPNPVSSNATIHIFMPEQGYARLAVFNTLGEEIAVPLDKSLDAGPHTMMFDAEHLPEGTYFFRLTVGASSRTRTLVHLR